MTIACQRWPCMSGARGVGKLGTADWIDSRLAAAVAPVVDILGSGKKLTPGQWGSGLCTEHQ